MKQGIVVIPKRENQRVTNIKKVIYGMSTPLGVGMAGVGIAAASTNPLLGAVLYASGASYAAGGIVHYMKKRYSRFR